MLTAILESTASVDYASVILQYILYGGILVVGLIVLLFLRKRDKRQYMVVAAEKTHRLIAEIERTLAGKKRKEYILFAKASKFRNAIGDLVVLAENEVVGNRNVAYDGVLTKYKTALDALEPDKIGWKREQTVDDIQTVLSCLREVEKMIKELQ